MGRGDDAQIDARDGGRADRRAPRAPRARAAARPARRPAGRRSRRGTACRRSTRRRDPGASAIAPENAPFLWPNSSLSTSVAGSARAVHRHELALAARQRVDRARDAFLAGAGRAADEHGMSLCAMRRSSSKRAASSGSSVASGSLRREQLERGPASSSCAQHEEAAAGLDDVALGDDRAVLLRAVDEDAVARAGVGDDPVRALALEPQVARRHVRVGAVDAQRGARLASPRATMRTRRGRSRSSRCPRATTAHRLRACRPRPRGTGDRCARRSPTAIRRSATCAC